MQRHTIVLIPGDGIGPEVANAARRVIDAAGQSSGTQFQWETMPAGEAAIKTDGDTLPEKTLDAVRLHKVGLKGPVGTPVGKGFRSVNVTLRKKLDLYAAVRPVRTMPGVKTRYDDVDLRAAFRYANRRRRKKVTVLHKANIMKLTDGLFLKCSRRVWEEEYPNIEYEELIIDNGCMQLVKDPTRFDVLLMENLYGDLISDLCAGLVGGLGVVPGANIGELAAVFEAVHGTAPDIAGKGVANPLACIMSGVMMLNHLYDTTRDEGCKTAGDKIKNAYNTVLSEGKTLTRDLGGTAGTEQFTDAMLEKVR